MFKLFNACSLNLIAVIPAQGTRMQTVQLSDALTDFNLNQAWSKVYENQGCAGVDRQTLEAFAGQLHLNLETLRNEVLYETYQPLPLLRVAVEKPGGSQRQLSIPTVRDRVLQTAVTRVIEPLFEAEFEDCSFAYRKGRSVDQALERIQSLQRRGYHWVVDADIFKVFFADDFLILCKSQNRAEQALELTDNVLRQLNHPRQSRGLIIVSPSKGLIQESPKGD